MDDTRALAVLKAYRRETDLRLLGPSLDSLPPKLPPAASLRRASRDLSVYLAHRYGGVKMCAIARVRGLASDSSIRLACKFGQAWEDAPFLGVLIKEVRDAVQQG